MSTVIFRKSHIARLTFIEPRITVLTQPLVSLCSSGLGTNIVRDLPAFGTYFALYEMIKDALESSHWPLWASSFTAGAWVAGPT